MRTRAAATSLDGKALVYRRREPESTVLYKLVADNLEPFLRFTREHYKKPLPGYVRQELRRFLDCGVLSKGFVRLLCDRCGKDIVVGLSCKGRGICPSCGGSRPLLAAKAKVLCAVIRIVMRVVLG